jgi:hypothetical protein
MVLVSSMAFANVKSLNCTGDLSKFNYSPGDIQTISLKASLITDWMKDVTVVVTAKDYENRNEVTVGRALELESDRNYKPIKNADHIRFDLTKLTEVKKFGRFYPSDSCQIQVMIPKNAMGLTSFNAPTQIHCDQSGGVATLKCIVK